MVFLASLVMIFAVVPREIKSSADYGLDPAFFPLTLLWLLAGLGALLVVTRLGKQADAITIGSGLSRRNWLFIAVATAYFWFGFKGIDTIGYVIAGALMVAVLMFAIEKRHARWSEVAAFPLLASFLIYWLLYHVFSVQLPSGPF